MLSNNHVVRQVQIVIEIFEHYRNKTLHNAHLDFGRRFMRQMSPDANEAESYD